LRACTCPPTAAKPGVKCSGGQLEKIKHMKAHKKSTKDLLRERKGNSGKNRQKKVWKFSYKVTDEKYISSWKKEKLNEWYDDIYSSFISVDHAIKQLNKQLRSYSFYMEYKLKGKEARLINKETGEIVLIEIINGEIIKSSSHCI
jgi:hypothetical protein